MWRFRDIGRVRSRVDLEDWWSCRYWTQGLRPGFDRLPTTSRSLRCWLGIHDSEWHDACGPWHSYVEPPEPGFCCKDCGNEVFPVRTALLLTLEGSRLVGPLLERYHEWRWRNDDLQ